MKNQLILRTSGFAIVVALFLVSLGLLVVYLFATNFNESGLIQSLLGFLIGAYFILIGGRLLIFNKIVLTTESLIFDVQEFGRALFQFGDKQPLPASLTNWRRTIVPRFYRNKIELENIKHILIAPLKSLDKMKKELKSQALDEALEFWHQWFLSVNQPGPTPLWLAAQFTPVMFIQAKSGNSYVVSTKPYSKNGFRKLVKEFKNLNVPITTDPGLVLE